MACREFLAIGMTNMINIVLVSKCVQSTNSDLLFTLVQICPAKHEGHQSECRQYRMDTERKRETKTSPGRLFLGPLRTL